MSRITKEQVLAACRELAQERNPRSSSSVQLFSSTVAERVIGKRHWTDDDWTASKSVDRHLKALAREHELVSTAVYWLRAVTNRDEGP